MSTSGRATHANDAYLERLLIRKTVPSAGPAYFGRTRVVARQVSSPPSDVNSDNLIEEVGNDTFRLREVHRSMHIFHLKHDVARLCVIGGCIV